MPEDQRRIKLDASAASLMTKIQGSPLSTHCPCQVIVYEIPCILVIWEALLAADLMIQLIFKEAQAKFGSREKIVKK